DSLLDEKTINHNFDGVVLALIQRGEIVHRIELAVDANTDVAILAKFFEFLAIRAFAAANDGREDHDTVVGLREFTLKNGLNDGFTGLARDGIAAIGTMRHANGSVDDAKVIVNFSDGADGGARRTRSCFLFDGDGRRKTLDDVDIRTFHLIEELARVGGKRFDVTPLALGINCVERERRLAG